MHDIQRKVFEDASNVSLLFSFTESSELEVVLRNIVLYKYKLYYIVKVVGGTSMLHPY